MDLAVVQGDSGALSRAPADGYDGLASYQTVLRLIDQDERQLICDEHANGGAALYGGAGAALAGADRTGSA